MNFILDCKTWRSGGDSVNRLGDGPTYMLNYLGEMCCLGQFCEQLGVDRELLLDVGWPSKVDHGDNIFTEDRKEMGKLSLRYDLMTINDNGNLSAHNRIAKIRRKAFHLRHHPWGERNPEPPCRVDCSAICRNTKGDSVLARAMRGIELLTMKKRSQIFDPRPFCIDTEIANLLRRNWFLRSDPDPHTEEHRTLFEADHEGWIFEHFALFGHGCGR